MSVSCKKLQLIPLGDKEERNRVYTYLKNGIYSQYRILNTYMSQVGTLYYSCNRNVESEEFTSGFDQIFKDTETAYRNLGFMAFGDYLRKMEEDYKKHMKDLKDKEYKESYNAIFRNTNEAIWDIEQAKGLGMAGNAGMRVKQDFSTALKNGLARGERQLPFYKRDFPLLVPSRFLTFYSEDEVYTNEQTGEECERINYCIKFVNGIRFKVVIGSQGKRDLYLLPLLDSILHDPENYKVCGSSIQITKQGKIILNLTTNINKREKEYEPVKGRVMGLSMGYDKCLVAALSDKDKMYEIGTYDKDGYIERRIRLQNERQLLQMKKKGPEGSGHGRKRKMRDLDNMRKRESNIVRYYNHRLSKQVVEFAKKNKVEAIVIEEINASDLNEHPTMLRNWSYYQLQDFIKYKAGKGIKVMVSSKEENRKVCCNCGKPFEKKDVLPKEIEWTGTIHFTCPNCKKQIEYSFNKAKNMALNG